MPSTETQQTPLIELDLLKTLVAIADTGNFSAAAEAVFRTPSAVSMQVKRVEEMVGTPLFKRDSRSVKPTPEGEILLEHGRRLLALNREMITQFMTPDVAGIVRLGAPDDVAERSLPAMLRRFSESHCCVTVDVVVDSSASLQRRVKHGELDLILFAINPGIAKEKGIEIILQERLVWAGVKNGIAHAGNPVPISVWEEGCSWRANAVKSLEQQQREYRIAFMSAHISGQRAAMLADLAIAPIPLSSCGNGIVELGEKEGLPELEDYALGILVCNDPSTAVLAAADHLRASFN